VRFPWQLPERSSDGTQCCDGVGREELEIAVETLFIDITFDFILFPAEIATQTHGRTECCHILKMEDFSGKDTEWEEVEECDSIAMAVAIRIGALVAIVPSGGEERMGNNDNKGGRRDGYQYYYHRGNNALTVSDLDEHCRGIDIILEEMRAVDVARIIGDAFSEGDQNKCSGCHARGGKPWHVMGKLENVSHSAATGTSNLKTIDSIGKDEQATKHFSWNLKVHHPALEADGLLPLSNNGCVNGDPIDRNMLDMILLQSNASLGGEVCISVPKTQAIELWKEIDPTLVRALEKPVELSPRKMSPVRKVVTARIPHSQEASPNREKDAKAERYGKPKTTTRSQPKPQQTALFARGKKTKLGGSRRKKPKFTLGPA